MENEFLSELEQQLLKEFQYLGHQKTDTPADPPAPRHEEIGPD